MKIVNQADRASLVLEFRKNALIASRRRGELARICDRMKADGALPLDGLNLAIVAANALVFWKRQDLSYVHILELTRECATEAEARKAVAMMQRRYAEQSYAFRLIPGRVAGRMLTLVCFDRRELEIRTMDAIDETREERKTFVKAKRRAADKERKARKRREIGMTQRGRNLSKEAPWVILGVSRAKFYRSRMHETECPLTVLLTSDSGQTVSCMVR